MLRAVLVLACIAKIGVWSVIPGKGGADGLFDWPIHPTIQMQSPAAPPIPGITLHTLRIVLELACRIGIDVQGHIACMTDAQSLALLVIQLVTNTPSN